MFSVVSAVRFDRPVSPVTPAPETFSVVRLVRFETSNSPVTPVLLMFNVVRFGRFKTSSTFVRVGTPFLALLKSTVVRFVKYSS